MQGWCSGPWAFRCTVNPDVVTRDRVLVAPKDVLQSASSPLASGAAVCSHSQIASVRAVYTVCAGDGPQGAQLGPTERLTALRVLGAWTPEACC